MRAYPRSGIDAMLNGARIGVIGGGAAFIVILCVVIVSLVTRQVVHPGHDLVRTIDNADLTLTPDTGRTVGTEQSGE